MTELLLWPELDIDTTRFDPGMTRRLNRVRVLNAVRRMGPLSRADLTRRMGLSAPTVSALVADLVGEDHLLRWVGIGESSGGRRPALLAFNGEYGYIAGVDIGSRTLRVALADLEGRVVARHHEPTDPAGGERLVQQICLVIERVVTEAGVRPDRLLAIGAGAPGMTDVRTGRVINAVNIPGWLDVPLRSLLETRFGVPAVIDNDANMAALGERWRGSARDVADFVFIALGAGVGAGVIVGGRLLRGSNWSAGEISHIHLNWRGWQVDYGDQGFLESKVAELAGGRSCSARDRAFSDIFGAVRAGDGAAAAIVEDLAAHLGTAIANIVAVLDPALVVFGGGVSQAGEQLLEPVRRVVGRIVPNVPRMEVTALGDEAQLYGSLYSASQLADRRLHALMLAPAESRPRRARTSKLRRVSA